MLNRWIWECASWFCAYEITNEPIQTTSMNIQWSSQSQSWIIYWRFLYIPVFPDIVWQKIQIHMSFTSATPKMKSVYKYQNIEKVWIKSKTSMMHVHRKVHAGFIEYSLQLSTWTFAFEHILGSFWRFCRDFWIL